MDQLAERFKAAIVAIESERDEYEPETIELFFQLYRAYIRFTEVYAEFDREKNIDNWMKAKQATTAVLRARDKDEPLLRRVMNQIWRTNEFNDVYQNKWIQSELDRLRAPAAERYDPYNYIKRREEEERRRQEEPQRQEEPRRQEYERIDNPNYFSKMYPMPKTKAHAFTVLNLQENATKPQIKNAYKTLSMSLHPDKHHQDEQIEYTVRQQQVTEAYNLLKGGKPQRTMQRKNRKKSNKKKSRRH